MIPDPQRAADHLFGLWQGFSNFQLALGIPEPASIESRVDDAVRAFLRAYPRPAPTA